MVGEEIGFIVGRADDCDIVLADDSVSRRHAELLVFPDGMLFLTDCASSFGTTLIRDGVRRPLHQEVLMPDDRLVLGELEMGVDDLLQLVRQSRSDASAVPVRASAPPDEPVTERWPEGAVLMRCICGQIKPKGQPCRHCRA